jgi:NAD-dependent deacetylase
LEQVQKADALLIIGSALQVYPAAGLIDEIGPEVPRAYLDPGDAFLGPSANMYRIQKKATEGLAEIRDWLKKIGAL